MVKAYVWVVVALYIVTFFIQVVLVSSRSGNPQANPWQMLASLALALWGIFVLIHIHGVHI